jgi:hypothetical protein
VSIGDEVRGDIHIGAFLLTPLVPFFAFATLDLLLLKAAEADGHIGLRFKGLDVERLSLECWSIMGHHRREIFDGL